MASMIWLTPAAWFGIAALAAPLAIHLLVHRRSDPFPFPSLQVLQPTRLASIRRHRLKDIPLLVVRAAILMLAVAALAGPLIVTASRRALWNNRVARAIVVDTGGADGAERTRLARQEGASAFRSTLIETPLAGEGLRRAVAWLEEAPPARREIVCVSPLAIGSVTAADLAAVPKDVGVRFVRSGTLPPTRTVDLAPVLTWADTRTITHNPGGVAGDLRVRPRTATLTGPETRASDAGAPSPLTLPLEIVAAGDQRAAIDAAVSAVVAQRTLVPAPHQSARLVFSGAPDSARAIADAATVRLPWIGDAIARIAQDEDVIRTASDVRTAHSDVQLRKGPWQTIAAGADGGPAVAAAQAAGRLIVVSAAPAADFLTPVLIRSILNALAEEPDLRAVEIVQIPDAQLRRWERAPADVPAQVRPTNADDDRRWFWGAVLGLIVLEAWMRRAGAQAAELDTIEERADRVA
jgi:hypothetical protein